MEIKKQAIELELKLNTEKFEKDLSKIKREYCDPILIKSDKYLSDEELEAEEKKLSDKLGIKVVILNGGFNLLKW